MEASWRSAATVRLAIGLCAAALLPFLLLAPSARPEADDFVFAGIVAQHGFLGAQSWWYTNWCGRFVSTAVLSALPAKFDLIAVYPWVCLGLLVAQMAATWWFLAAVGRAASERFNILRFHGAAAIVLPALYVTQMPSPREGFYWLSGAMTYQLPTILGLCLGALGLSIRRETSRLGIAWRTVAAALLALAVAGCNETVWLPGALVLSAAAAWALRRRHPSAVLWIAALAAFVAAAWVVYVAPGNAVRLAYHVERRPLVARLGLALGTSLLYTVKWAAYPALWAVAVLFVAVLDAPADLRSAPSPRRAVRRRLALLAFGAYVIVLSGFLPSFLATGHKPPARAQNALFFPFLIVWLAGVAVAWNATRRRAAGAPRLMHGAKRFVLGLLAIGLLAIGNLPAAVHDLAVRAPEYRRATVERYAELSAAARARRRCGRVAPLGGSPRTLGCWEIGRDAYVDQHFARYFGLESVMLIEDAADHRPTRPQTERTASRDTCPSSAEPVP